MGSNFPGPLSHDHPIVSIACLILVYSLNCSSSNEREGCLNENKKGITREGIDGYIPLISDNGFVAVSTEFQSAHKYSVGGENEDEYILLSKLKRGNKALFIGNENPTHDKKQGEILLQAGTGY